MQLLWVVSAGRTETIWEVCQALSNMASPGLWISGILVFLQIGGIISTYKLFPRDMGIAGTDSVSELSNRKSMREEALSFDHCWPMSAPLLYFFSEHAEVSHITVALEPVECLIMSTGFSSFLSDAVSVSSAEARVPGRWDLKEGMAQGSLTAWRWLLESPTRSEPCSFPLLSVWHSPSQLIYHWCQSLTVFSSSTQVLKQSFICF